MAQHESTYFNNHDEKYAGVDYYYTKGCVVFDNEHIDYPEKRRVYKTAEMAGF